MKAILVIDHLKDCTDCPLSMWLDSHTIQCRKLMQSKKVDQKRFGDCPLKRMPKKIESGKIENGTKTNIPIPVEHFAMGYNACIDEILGETE